MKNLNDVKFFDTTTYTMGGVETVNRYYDDFPNIKWGSKNGFTREKAYTVVQKNAQNSLKKNITFYESLAKDSLINKLISNKDLKKMFDLNYHTKKINIIFKRVFK